MAFLIVFMLQLGNEGLDVLDGLNGSTSPNWRNGLVDMANTLFWPLLFTLWAQFRLPAK